jgi:hypothetical protein
LSHVDGETGRQTDMTKLVVVFIILRIPLTTDNRLPCNRVNVLLTVRHVYHYSEIEVMYVFNSTY